MPEHRHRTTRKTGPAKCGTRSLDRQSGKASRECAIECADLFTNMPGGVAVVKMREDGTGFAITDLNPAAERIWQVTAVAALGQGLGELFPETAYSGFADAVERVWRTGATERCSLCRQSATNGVQWLEHYLYRLPSGAVVVIFDDVSGRVRAEEELRQSEARYRAIVENQTDLIIRFTPEGTLTYVNAIYCQFFGEQREQLLGHSFWHHLPGDDRQRLTEHLAQLSPEHPTAIIEHRVLSSTGENRWLQWTDRAVFDDRGRVLEFLAVGRDVTEHKRAEESLEQLNRQRMEEHERRQFLSRKLIQLLELDRQRVAMELHDHIGQILGTLKMDLELLALQVAPRHPNLIELARSAYQKAVQAVKGVKDISYGLRPSILDNLGLVSSIAALINDFQSVAGIEIRFFHKNLPKRFDQEKETAIYRIVQEALTNIVKHANASEVYINLSRREHALHLTVEDNGTGFIPEDFPREASKGKLGLLIMQERVAQLNGQLSIESRVGGGVYLWAEIPL